MSYFKKFGRIPYRRFCQSEKLMKEIRRKIMSEVKAREMEE